MAITLKAILSYSHRLFLFFLSHHHFLTDFANQVPFGVPRRSSFSLSLLRLLFTLSFKQFACVKPNSPAMSQEYSYQDVAEHNTKKDLFVVIHDKVYDCSKFVDEHPYVLQFPILATSCWIPLFFTQEGKQCQCCMEMSSFFSVC